MPSTLKHTSTLRFAIASLIHALAFELTKLSAVTLKKGSPERIYVDGITSKRRQAFDSVVSARLGKPVPRYAYPAAACLTCFALFLLGMMFFALVDGHIFPDFDLLNLD